jgi:hypothetical protein
LIFPLKEAKVIAKRVDTTQSASVTELFPALAFNKSFKPNTVDELRDFLIDLNFSDVKVKSTFVTTSNIEAGKKIIANLIAMKPAIYKDKMENAIGILNFLYETNKNSKIEKIMWGYREKPNESGFPTIPKTHAGDIFIFFKNKMVYGVSLKAGTQTSKEPLLNTYVATTYKKLGKEIELKRLENALWDTVYSKIPGVTKVANKTNYLNKGVKDKVTQLYVNHFVSNQTKADELYQEMLLVSRKEVCKTLNALTTDEFIFWVKNNFNLQSKSAEVPLVLVKAIGKTASLKSDDLASMLARIKTFKAYLNSSSVQGWFIDIETEDTKKKLIMTIRSDSGVRAEKKPGQQGRLGKYTMLKLQYSGIQ